MMPYEELVDKLKAKLPQGKPGTSSFKPPAKKPEVIEEKQEDFDYDVDYDEDEDY